MSHDPTSIRVLHLLGRPADLQTGRAIEALTRGQGDRTFVARIGVGGDWRHPLSAAWLLRSAAKGRDLVQCWDDRAMTAAIASGVPRIVFSPQQWPTPRAVRWLRAAMGYRDVHLVCPSATMRRYYVGRGVPIGRVHLVRPGVDFSRVKRRRDPALREALGIPPDDFVMLAPGESTDAAGHHLAVWTGSILSCLDQRYRVLMLGRGPRAASAMALSAKLGQRRLVLNADERLGRRCELETLTAAADIALVTASPGGGTPCAAGRPAASTLPVAICMASALPIVSVVTPTLAELLEDRHTALMVGAPRARLLAAKVLALREDKALCRQIADTAAAEAYELLSLSRFRQGWREAYARITAGGNSEVPLSDETRTADRA